jgi:hypothetical protein
LYGPPAECEAVVDGSRLSALSRRLDCSPAARTPAAAAAATSHEARFREKII